MEIEYFHEFVELASCLNYREAAGRLAMSQSALSKHIKALEEHYGVLLFDRDRQSVSLTDDGALLLDYAQRLYGLYGESRETMLSRRRFRPFVLAGVLENPELHRDTTALVHAISNRMNGLVVRVADSAGLSATDLSRTLLKGQADCCISYELAGSIADERIAVVGIRSVPLDIIVPADSPIATKENLRYKDLLGASFVHLAGARFTPFWRLVERHLQRRNIPHSVNVVPTDSMYDLVNLNLGSSLLVMPRLSRENVTAATLRMKAIPVDEPDFALSLDAAYLAGREDEAMTCVLDELKRHFQEDAGAL